MYGMVNRAIEDLVVSIAGADAWLKIRETAGYEHSEFYDSTVYDDEVTYKLVSAASEHLGIPADKILHEFGRHWILYTGKEGWASVFELCGDNMLDFLNGLDSMHARVQIALPEAQMPQFSVVEKDEHLELTYMSPRPGLAPMVLGLLDGLAEQFNEHWSVEQVSVKGENSNDVFVLKQLEKSIDLPDSNAA